MTSWLNLTFAILAVGIGMAIAWLAARWYSRPATAPPDDSNQFAHETLARLQDLTRLVKAGVDQHSSCVEEISAQLTQSLESDDDSVLAAVADLIDANQRMKRQLDTAEERLQAQARQIESHAVEARTDALTQLANRRALDDELKRCAAEYERRGTPTTLLLLDVDHFKKFNDSHGHQAGDEVLRSVGRVLRNTLGETALVARYGGEEFAVVFAGLGCAAIASLAEKARQAIGAMPLRFGGRQLSITASGGLADFLTGETERELVRRADEALYASKKAGRKCAHYNDGRMNHLVQPGHIQSMLPAAAASEKVGDEWLFDTEGLVDTLQKEPIPQISERPAFFDDLIRRISQWRRGGAPLALLLVQVDAFGRIHSDHGPTAADVVLRVAAQLINALMRDMDHVARLGDDTFALILPGALLNDGLAIGERLRQAVERCRLPRKAGTGWFTVSVGVVEASEGDDLRRILERAREALGNAANQGRNCVIGHDAEGFPVRADELVAR